MKRRAKLEDLIKRGDKVKAVRKWWARKNYGRDPEPGSIGVVMDVDSKYNTILVRWTDSVTGKTQLHWTVIESWRRVIE